MIQPTEKRELTAAEAAQSLYQQKITRVLKRLRGIDQNYFIRECLKTISEIKRDNDENFNFEFVWLLAIKLSALHSSGERKPKTNEIINIINNLWEINECTIPYLAPNLNPLIAIRAMVSQQSTLQHNFIKSYADIMRQAHLLSDSKILNDHFKHAYGLTIASYCFIWFILLTQIASSECGSTDIDLTDLILKCRPYVTIQDIYNFFKAFSITTQAMPVFFSNYKNYDSEFGSYFYDSPLKRKPFLFTGKNIRTISSNLAASSASFLLPQLFKDTNEISSEFKRTFTGKFEHYIGELLASTSLQCKNENDIRNLYRDLGESGKTNNVVDHMLISTNSKTVILFESKGVEQTDFVKVIMNPETLQSRLNDSHIKGILQSQRCINILKKHPSFANYNFHSFIIVNDDYGFSDAESLKQLIGNTASQTTLALTPSPIPLTHILFVRISTLEIICNSIEDGDYSVDKLISNLGTDRPVSLEVIHRTLTNAHPAKALKKKINLDSPAIKCLLSQKPNSPDNYNLFMLLQDISKLVKNLNQHL